jgi:outer membrane protein assembly factor BamA
MTSSLVVLGVLAQLAFPVPPSSFDGNKALDAALLGEALARADASPAESEAEAIDHRTQWIVATYYDHGYADVTVTPVRYEEPAPHVVFRIAEGRPYRIGFLSARGDELGLVRFSVRQGDLLVRSALVRALTEAKAAYVAEGYRAVEINPRVRKDEQRHVLDVVFDVTPGPRDAPAPMR